MTGKDQAVTQSTLETSRLVLRPFRASDAPAVRQLAGDRLIADTTLSIPHPYEDGAAEEWIATHAPAFKAGTLAVFAMVRREDEGLVGAISLKIDRDFDKAELGYWVGTPFWNSGYATEAAVAIIDYGFRDRNLNRISAKHLARNPASGRVMQKAGMQPEGTARQDTKKWGRYEDLVSYGILREEWLQH